MVVKLYLIVIIFQVCVLMAGVAGGYYAMIIHFNKIKRDSQIYLRMIFERIDREKS